MQAVVDIIRGCVAKLLLWPLDVVDHLASDTLNTPFTRKEIVTMGSFMVCWYGFFLYSLYSLLECLT